MEDAGSFKRDSSQIKALTAMGIKSKVQANFW